MAGTARRFATADEPPPISAQHALSLASAAYAMMKDNNIGASERMLGILIGYLKGNGDEQ